MRDQLPTNQRVKWLTQAPTVTLTPGFVHALNSVCADENVASMITINLLHRFFNKDWGMEHLADEDRKHDEWMNDDAIENGGRVIGSYRLFEDEALDQRVWLYLEPDHSVLTILLPEEY